MWTARCSQYATCTVRKATGDNVDTMLYVVVTLLL